VAELKTFPLTTVPLEAGQRVLLGPLARLAGHAAGGGAPLAPALVRGASRDLVWLLEPPGERWPIAYQPADQLVLVQARSGDARYATQAAVITLRYLAPDRLVLRRRRYATQAAVIAPRGRELLVRLRPTWLRLDPRAYPRCDVPALPVDATPLPDDGPPGPRRMFLLNLSAGGALLASDVALARGDRFVCHFELDGLAIETEARVVRLTRPYPDDPAVLGLGVAFDRMADATRRHIDHWVLRQLVQGQVAAGTDLEVHPGTGPDGPGVAR
jgi:hypothetical protein